jgi:hypothetical protein
MIKEEAIALQAAVDEYWRWPFRSDPRSPGP